MALGQLKGFSTGSPGPLKHAQLRTPASPASLRCSQGAWSQPASCSLGDYHNSSQRHNLHSSSSHIPDPIDEEWKIMRRRMSSLDAGAASTSGRAPSTSSSSSRGPPPNKLPNGYNLEDSWDLTDDSGYTPFPGNLPTSEEGVHGMELWHGAPALHLSDSKEVWGKLGQVYVLLFGVGEAETEGIYSLRAMSREEGLPVDTIVAFQDLEDAERYCTLLQATMPHVPHVMPIEPRELLDFCCDAGYSCRLEPRGSWFTPPDYNVGITDWERSLRLREGQWSVLERDPDLQTPSDPPPAAQPPQQEWRLPPQAAPGFGRPGQRYHNNAGAYFSADHELEELKARLERMLPEE